LFALLSFSFFFVLCGPFSPPLLFGIKSFPTRFAALSYACDLLPGVAVLCRFSWIFAIYCLRSRHVGASPLFLVASLCYLFTSSSPLVNLSSLPWTTFLKIYSSTMSSSSSVVASLDPHAEQAVSDGDSLQQNGHDSPVSHLDSEPLPSAHTTPSSLSASSSISATSTSTATNIGGGSGGGMAVAAAPCGGGGGGYENGGAGYYPTPFHHRPHSVSAAAAAATFFPPGGCSLNKMVNPSLSQDTTLTKVFVGGLAWQTKSETLHKHFSQYGDILEAVVIMDKTTGRSKGFGFVTFSDKEAAEKATANPNPMIDNRRANCNLAALGAQKRLPMRRHEFDGYEPQSYAVPGNMSMQLQFQVPGSGYSSDYRYDYPNEGLPMPYSGYSSGYDSPSTTSSPLYSPSIPYTPFANNPNPYYSYPQTPPSPAYFYPPTPGSGQLRVHYSPDYMPGPGAAAGGVPFTGPSGAPVQGPPPPLLLPHSHPNAVTLGTQEGGADPRSADSSVRRSGDEHSPANGQSEAVTVGDAEAAPLNGFAQPGQPPIQAAQQAAQLPSMYPNMERSTSGDPSMPMDPEQTQQYMVALARPQFFSPPGATVGHGRFAQHPGVQSYGGYYPGAAAGPYAAYSQGVHLPSPQRGRSRPFSHASRIPMTHTKPQQVAQVMDNVVAATQLDAQSSRAGLANLSSQFQRLDVQEKPSAHDAPNY